MDSINTTGAPVSEILYMFTEWRYGINAAITLAVDNDDPATFSRLLMNLDTEYERNASFKTGVMKAIMDGRDTIMSVLRLHNVNKVVVPETGATLLHLAGTPSAARTLLAQGANPNSRDQALMTPVHTAAMRRQADVVEELIKFGADANVVNARGYTPLHIAATQEDLASIRALTGVRTIDVNARDPNFATPLHYVALKGNADCTLHLLKTEGCDVNAAMRNGITPLHAAVYSGCVGVVKHLLSASGANANVYNIWRRTPLHFAALTVNPPAVLALLEAKADVNAQDADGCTPLHHAVKMKSEFITRVLAEQDGINLEAQDINGDTPLAVATRNNTTEVVNVLVSAGAKK